MSKIDQEKRGVEKECEERCVLLPLTSVSHLNESATGDYHTCVRRERSECQTRVKSHAAGT